MPPSAATLARLIAVPDPAPPDAQLLRAFVATRNETPFEELVRRHGPMVLATCRRVLGNIHDAEDAFQAVFLVLARKANTIRGNLAGWLYGVAVRTARGVRIMRDRRSRRSQKSGDRSQNDQERCCHHPTPDSRLLTTELAAVIDEELAKLPAHYREAIVLCELRGLSRKQAAAELGIPEGTLSSRLAGAKRKLAALLSARGLATPAALAAVLTPASVSAGLVRAAVSVTRGAVGPVACAAASAVVKGMLFDQLRAVALAAGIVLTAVCGGWAMTGTPGGSDPAPAPRPADDPAVKLVEQLGAPEFADREAAGKKLREMGSRAEPALKAALKSENPEVRQRAGRVLAQIRKDTLAVLAKDFDPAKDTQPDHPIWSRFKQIVGDSRASRDLFARIIKNADWLRRLDAAETGPDAAAQQYRAALVEVGRIVHSNMSVGFVIFVWPCDTADQTAYLLLLGSYPGTSSAQPAGMDAEFQAFRQGETQLHSARGLKLGLQGKEIAPGPKNHFDETAAITAGSDRVFAGLLVAWLANRTDSDTLTGGVRLAIRHEVADVLPVARRLAADKELSPRSRCAALAAVAQFGTRADLPLFKALFADETPVATSIENRTGYFTFGTRITTQARDAAAGMALLLFGEDPAPYGFGQASGRWQKIGNRPSLTRYELTHFGFHDVFEKARADTHAKVKAFLDKQPKPEPKKEEPKPDPAVVKLVEQLGSPEFADREAAQKSLRELGVKAMPALRELGVKSDSPEVVKRCTELLDTLRSDLLRSKDSPVWQKFKALAGDDEDAWKLYLRVVGTRQRAAMLLAAVEDSKKAAASYAKECKRIAASLQPPPDPDSVKNTKYTDDLAALLFLGTLVPGTPDAGKVENGAVISIVLIDTLRTEGREGKRAFGRLFASWTELRPYVWQAGLFRAMAENVPAMVDVARKALAAKDRTGGTNELVLALHVLGQHGTAANLPLVMKFADDTTECGRLEFSKFPGGVIRGSGTVRPLVKDTDVVAQVRDVAVIAALQLRKQKPQDFGFEMDVVSDHGPLMTADLSQLGFCRDADREAAHKKARAWLDKQKE